MPPKRPASAAFKAATGADRKSKTRARPSAARKTGTKPVKPGGKGTPNTAQGSKVKSRAVVQSESSSEDDNDIDSANDIENDNDESDDASEVDSDEEDDDQEEGAVESLYSEGHTSDSQSEGESESATATPQRQRSHRPPAATSGSTANRAIASAATSSTAAVAAAGKQKRATEPSSRRPNRHLSPSASQQQNEQEDLPPVLPEKLLTALLYSHFQQQDTKIGRDARGLVGKYVETFIREAVARAVVERTGGAAAGESGGASRRGAVGAGDFLEVEDLEKLAPQLILDF